MRCLLFLAASAAAVAAAGCDRSADTAYDSGARASNLQYDSGSSVAQYDASNVTARAEQMDAGVSSPGGRHGRTASFSRSMMDGGAARALQYDASVAEMMDSGASNGGMRASR